MPDDAVTRGDLEALRSELKDEIATTRLEVAQLRTDMSERFGAVQAEFGAVRADIAGVRKDLAVLQVDIRKDLAAFGQQQEQMRQDIRDIRQTMDRWQATTTRQLWTMVSVVSGAIVMGLLKLVFFP
jgi:predicted  nucleic acid-binding Zn-ribbon protein